MTPADRQAMIETWSDYHFGLDPDLLPDVPPACKRMYAAGLLRAREQAAAQLEELSYPDTMPDAPGMVRLRVEIILLALAKKIRSGE
ncbi:MAG: hypothetical protein KBE22_16670 [Candidatus Accumulibacter sp.]|nr:hypothetical protein [Accumulibacter sp.]